VALESGDKISLAGSNIIATDDVSLKTGRDITVTTAENHYHAESASQSKKSGVSGTGGIGVSIGTNKLKTQDSETTLTHTGSTGGSVTISAGTVLNQFKGNMANGVLAGLNGSDSADSTTRAAVSEGTITIRDKENQQQDVAELSRDVENANPGFEQIFDKEKEQNRLKAAQLIAEINIKAIDIARTEDQIAGEKAKQDLAALVAGLASGVSRDSKAVEVIGA